MHRGVEPPEIVRAGKPTEFALQKGRPETVLLYRARAACTGLG